MPRKNSYITVTDQFCGAGGSSQGVRELANHLGGGLEVKLALNHWDLAIETHNTNFPDTQHDCTDISACDPRRYFSTDILITSPECTNHSLAKGKKKRKAQGDLFDRLELDPGAERSRATMWDVPRFAEYHNYNIIIVENVVDARSWIMWEAWLKAMHLLGYDHKCVYLNSMHFHPCPQSRDRMYVVFWKKGNKAPDLDFRPTAYCSKCNKDIDAVQWFKNSAKKYGKYKTQYLYRCPDCTNLVEPYYYASFNAIDWTIPSQRIGDRKKPLSQNTLNRIRHGLEKYSGPQYVANYSPGYTKPLWAPTGAMKTVDSHGLLNLPFIIKGEHVKNINYVKSSVEAFATQTTTQSFSLVVPQIIEMNRTGKSRGSDQPLSTVLANGNHHGLLMPIIINNKGQSKSHPSTDPLRTQTNKPHYGIVTNEAWNSFIGYYYGKSQNSHVSDPIGTQTTRERNYIVSFESAKIDDCYYRMLKAPEIQTAMAFAKDYIILGNSREKVKQLGNAVTPPAMKWLVERAIESLM